jgi:hypothetical protein
MYTNNKKGYSMKAVYIKRRVLVALFLLISGVIGLRIVSITTTWLSKPTFTCQAAEVRLGYQMIWDIADNNCSGNITDAAKQIMEDNYIKGNDLRVLLPSTIIVIKGGN